MIPIHEPAVKKIFAISLMGRERSKAYAVDNGEQLIIQKIVPIKGLYAQWKDALIEEIEERKQNDFICLVEEKTEHIAQHGSQINLEDIDINENRINYYIALDWYFAMANMGNIIMPPDGQQFTITPQKVDPKRDEQGRTKYDVNWDQFSSGHRCVLLCVLAAAQEPVSGRYMKELYGPEPVYELWDPLRSFKAVTIGVDRALEKKWDKIRGWG
jgi:hypothetical protein